MRKKILLATTLIVSSFAVNAQCQNGRYASNVYSTVDFTDNVVYGSNTSYSGATTSLKFDFYEPQGDTASARPLIILAHGGSFIFGNETTPDMVTLCNEFAKKGFACASMTYRLGFFPVDSVNAVKAVVRAMQDMKACIRYFRKDFETANLYKIDTSRIFIGGTSAGAITALHTAYLTDDCEIEPYFGAAGLAALGGLEGNSGNPGYSSKVYGVINLCGALGRYHWLKANSVPFVSLHGTEDGTVKYSRGVVNPGVPLIKLDGSRMLHERAQALGIDNPFFTWNGADHTPFIGTDAASVAYMDTTINVIRDYLIDRLGCTNPILQATNAPFGVASLYSFTDCLLSLTDKDLRNVTLYPNPNNGNMTVKLGLETSSFDYQLFDVTGKILKNDSMLGNDLILNENLKDGIYFLHFQTNSGAKGVSRFVVQN